MELVGTSSSREMKHRARASPGTEGRGRGEATFMLAMLMGVQRRAPLPSVLASLITVAGGYAIFITWLQIKLPLGPWGI